MLKMAKALKRTKYQEHLHLEPNLLAQFHLDQQLLLHHLGHTKLEFDVPTKVVWKYTNHAFHQPTQSSEVPFQLVKSLLCHFELHRQLPLQVVQLSQTIAKISVVQQLFGNANSGRRYASMGASPNQAVHLCEVLLLPRVVHQSGPFHQTWYWCLP